MSQPPVPPRRVALPWGLIGMLLLVAGVERTLTRMEIDTIGPVALDWQLTRKAAATKAKGHDVLVFGDSLIKIGVQPKILKERAGRSVYNLAVSGNQPPASYYFLDRALRAGARPSAVVVDFKLDLLLNGPDYNTRQWPEIFGLRESLEMAWTAGDARLFGMTAVGSLLPSYRARHDLRASVFAALAGGSASRREELLSFRRNWRVNHGAQLFGRNPNCKDVVPPENLPDGSWHPDPVNAAYVTKFLKLAQAHGITVYWMLMPTAPGIRSVFVRNGDDARYERYVRGNKEGFPNLVVVDARRSGYPREVFADAVHLDRHGAWILSAEVASILRQGDRRWREGARWVDVAPYRDRSEGIPLEDFVESRLALEKNGVLKR